MGPARTEVRAGRRRGRYSVMVCTLVAISLLAGCGWDMRVRYMLDESTRVLSVEYQGVTHARKEKADAMLLQGVPVPPQEREWKVQETPESEEKSEDLRGDGEEKKEEPRVGARRVSRRRASEQYHCWKPEVILVPVGGQQQMGVLGCAEYEETHIACRSCKLGQYGAAIKVGLRAIRSRIVY